MRQNTEGKYKGQNIKQNTVNGIYTRQKRRAKGNWVYDKNFFLSIFSNKNKRSDMIEIIDPFTLIRTSRRVVA